MIAGGDEESDLRLEVLCIQAADFTEIFIRCSCSYISAWRTDFGKSILRREEYIARESCRWLLRPVSALSRYVAEIVSLGSHRR
jgi:hypothetical protein